MSCTWCNIEYTDFILHAKHSEKKDPSKCDKYANADTQTHTQRTTVAETKKRGGGGKVLCTCVEQLHRISPRTHNAFHPFFLYLFSHTTCFSKCLCVSMISVKFLVNVDLRSFFCLLLATLSGSHSLAHFQAFDIIFAFGSKPCLSTITDADNQHIF